MRKVWMAADSIVSPLGFDSKGNYENVRSGKTGIFQVENTSLSQSPFYASKLLGISTIPGMTMLEAITCQAIEAIFDTVNPPSDRTLFILSTTKGNISFLETGQKDHPRIDLHALAAFIGSKFGLNRNMVISNACISGVMSLIVGKRMIESGSVDHVLVAGVDVLSKFIISGFQSLQALSPEPCRPFDAERKGINLGECASAILITAEPALLNISPVVQLAGGGLSNDANHISGPSRTGEELAFAIQQALGEAGTKASEIDMISAHGTATLYNDEMEAKAFTIHGMNKVPVNSLKGYYGHTLGAAGILEVALSAEALKRDELLPSLGFGSLGVSQPLSVIKTLERRPLKTVLKTASGFGGCNAAIILRKEN
ncbi:MAG: beta-ketoacyl synthase N-terminal-like domain-containing protein [Chryseolinea sp.]